MKIAVEGCCHGDLDAIYRHIANLEQKHAYKVDLLLICGDFEAMRNHQDLQCMAVPNKYKEMKDFYKYYTSEKTAPILTLVIGGNHEASNYMWELYHGGWLAPNLYYLGNAGCVQVNGLRIAGASGIYKLHDFRLGHYEKMPYDQGSMRSIYHHRGYDVQKLLMLSKPDVFLSHDWPQNIAHHGDLEGLLRKKSFFRQDIENQALGSPPMMDLLKALKPDWWFAAHLHTRFEATVEHYDSSPSSMVEDGQATTGVNDQKGVSEEIAGAPRNPDEIMLDDEEDDVVAPPPPPPVLKPTTVTKFLALDKCLPKRDFLEVVDIPTTIPSSLAEVQDVAPVLSYDPEWLAITRAFHPWLSLVRHQPALPDDEQLQALVKKELEWVNENIPKKLSEAMLVSDCQQFVQTAPGPGSEGSAKFQQPPWYTNPQTEALCLLLDIPNKINPPPRSVPPLARGG
ncbi:DBR1-domain-containing protein [Pluteus cervinus]|uniref:DBR1-domain-containing protein n=1 Tax=Pluteus cervinus TaxID=181527 RepID=A0ACD3BA77_9AGAR|nr:DBR1-domain-containing protein [Pluteus cervinus]